MSNSLSSQLVPGAIPPIVGRALLVSNDPIVIKRLTTGMQQFAIAADACSDLLTAASLINSRKFEAIVIDIGLDNQAAHIFECIRLSPSNENSVTFAIVASRSGADFKVQPTFVMPKPLTDELIASVLKAALGLIIRNYRRYCRCPLTVPVLIRIDGKAQIPCEMMNISEGGLAVSTTVIFAPSVPVRAEFALPGDSTLFDIDSEICWCDKKGRAGVQFRALSPEQKALLQDWLSRKIEQGLPEPVSRLFQKVQ